MSDIITVTLELVEAKTQLDAARQRIAELEAELAASRKREAATATTLNEINVSWAEDRARMHRLLGSLQKANQ